MANSEIEKAKEVVKILIEKNHVEHHINHDDYRCNHVVHGICTLFALGASKERIQEYYNEYLKILDPLNPPKFKVDESNWHKYIGEQKVYEELLPFFENEIKTLGQEKTLKKFLPRLLPGFVGGAFHSLIQIGFGVEYGFPLVIAEGLAYACTYYYHVGEIINRLPANSSESLAPLEIAVSLSKMKLTPPKQRNPKFPVDEILDYHEFELGQLVSKWKLEVTTPDGIMNKLAELTRAILIVTFGSHRNNKLDFFLIHGLTGLHAIRVLLPYLTLDEQKRLLQLGLVGLLGNMWLQGMPNINLGKIMDYGGPTENISWESIKKKAIACNDEHVAKVVHSLIVIYEKIPNDAVEHEMILRCALMTTDFIKQIEDWEFDGIGFAK